MKSQNKPTVQSVVRNAVWLVIIVMGLIEFFAPSHVRYAGTSQGFFGLTSGLAIGYAMAILIEKMGKEKKK